MKRETTTHLSELLLGCLAQSLRVCCRSVAQLCLTLEPMDCSRPGFPVLHYLLAFAQNHVHWVSDAIQPSRFLLPPSPPALNLSQHQDLFQWVSSLHQVAKVLALQLQHQSFQWIFRVDFTSAQQMLFLLLLLLLRLPLLQGSFTRNPKGRGGWCPGGLSSGARRERGEPCRLSLPRGSWSIGSLLPTAPYF